MVVSSHPLPPSGRAKKQFWYVGRCRKKMLLCALGLRVENSIQLDVCLTAEVFCFHCRIWLIGHPPLPFFTLRWSLWHTYTYNISWPMSLTLLAPELLIGSLCTLSESFFRNPGFPCIILSGFSYYLYHKSNKCQDTSTPPAGLFFILSFPVLLSVQALDFCEILVMCWQVLD